MALSGSNSHSNCRNIFCNSSLRDSRGTWKRVSAMKIRESRNCGVLSKCSVVSDGEVDLENCCSCCCNCVIGKNPYFCEAAMQSKCRCEGRPDEGSTGTAPISTTCISVDGFITLTDDVRLSIVRRELGSEEFSSFSSLASASAAPYSNPRAADSPHSLTRNMRRSIMARSCGKNLSSDTAEAPFGSAPADGRHRLELLLAAVVSAVG
mmetsp:Transcript_38442/g.79898  ORF Transcript_38442/g.79898 Transcript_38442/m.79898 type:complete len:208 (-) Transcript_38442:1432-2055(-)